MTRTWPGVAAAVVSVGLALAACGAGGAPGGDAGRLHPTFTEPLRAVADLPDAPPTDTIQVFVCDVPVPTTDPIYGDMTLRLDLDPAEVAAELTAGVPQYFTALSDGRYLPAFVAGTMLKMSTADTHDDCVDRALAASDVAATVVMAVANAEHLASSPGGWGRPGTGCDTQPCPASATRRAVYVGASDFYDDASDDGSDDGSGDGGAGPLLDLVEHELGHTLDLPHSGDADQPHASALDVMSNSAAPRDVQPDRVDAQDTLAVNRLALGWLTQDRVSIAPRSGGSFALWPSNSTGPDTGAQLLVLPLDDRRFLTVEHLAAAGLDDFLPTSGIAVHLIDISAGVGIAREQLTLASAAPHLDLLHALDATWTLEGWTIRLAADIDPSGGAVQVEVNPTDR